MKVDPIFFALSIIIGLAISYFLGFYVTGRILFMVSPVGRVFTRFEIEVYWLIVGAILFLVVMALLNKLWLVRTKDVEISKK